MVHALCRNRFVNCRALNVPGISKQKLTLANVTITNRSNLEFHKYKKLSNLKWPKSTNHMIIRRAVPKSFDCFMTKSWNLIETERS